MAAQKGFGEWVAGGFEKAAELARSGASYGAEGARTVNSKMRWPAAILAGALIGTFGLVLVGVNEGTALFGSVAALLFLGLAIWMPLFVLGVLAAYAVFNREHLATTLGFFFLWLAYLSEGPVAENLGATLALFYLTCGVLALRLASELKGLPWLMHYAFLLIIIIGMVSLLGWRMPSMNMPDGFGEQVVQALNQLFGDENHTPSADWHEGYAAAEKKKVTVPVSYGLLPSDGVQQDGLVARGCATPCPGEWKREWMPHHLRHTTLGDTARIAVDMDATGTVYNARMESSGNKHLDAMTAAFYTNVVWCVQLPSGECVRPGRPMTVLWEQPY